MHPLIPSEMLSSAAQMVVYFITAIGVLMSFMMATRA